MDRLTALVECAHVWQILTRTHIGVRDYDYWRKVAQVFIAECLNARSVGHLQQTLEEILQDIDHVHATSSFKASIDREEPTSVSTTIVPISALLERPQAKAFVTQLELPDTAAVLDLRALLSISTEQAAIELLSNMLSKPFESTVYERFESINSGFDGIGVRGITSVYGGGRTVPLAGSLTLCLDHSVPLNVRSLAMEAARQNETFQLQNLSRIDDTVLDARVTYLAMNWQYAQLAILIPTQALDISDGAKTLGARFKDTATSEHILEVWEVWLAILRLGRFGGNASFEYLYDKGLRRALEIALDPSRPTIESLHLLMRATQDPHCQLPDSSLSTQRVVLDFSSDYPQVSAVPATGSALMLRDQILEVNGEHPTRAIERFLPGVSGNREAILVNLEHRLLESKEPKIDLKVLRSGEELLIRENLCAPEEVPMWFPATPPHDCVVALSDNMLYLNLTRAQPSDIESFAQRYSRCSGVVVDARGWITEATSRHLLEAIGTGARVHFGDYESREYVTGEERIVRRPQWCDVPLRNVPWAILISHRSLSGGEIAACMLKTATGGTMLGTATAGAFGITGRITLPSGRLLLVTMEELVISTLNVRLGVSIQPDIYFPDQGPAFVIGESIDPLRDPLIAEGLRHLRSGVGPSRASTIDPPADSYRSET